MKLLHNENLCDHTSIKIGGMAVKYYIPENQQELLDIISSLQNEKFNIIACGSNLLINDKGIYNNVIDMNFFNRDIIYKGSGIFSVGASVRLQTLINEVNLHGYGGMEYLFSVPGSIGGAVYMNAGRGYLQNKNICDFIMSVKAYHRGYIVEYSREKCSFGYRDSIFKKNGDIILSVEFAFLEQTIDVSKKNIKERLVYCKERQDLSYPNFGSLFSYNDGRILKMFSALHIGYRNGVMFSSKTPNWILNKGSGTYDQVIKLINLSKIFHKMIGKKAIEEICIWK